MLPTLVTADMRYWRIAPDPRLREHVLCYWMVEDTPQRASDARFQHGEDLLLPDGYSEIVFNRTSVSFERWQLGARADSTEMRGSYVIGGRSKSVGTHTSAPLQLAGVKLDPRFLRDIIGVPLHEFRDSTLPLRNLRHAGLNDLEEQIAESSGPTRMAALLDGFLLGALKRAWRPSTATDALLHRIHRDRGSTPIMHWARDASVDARSLERAFCAATGMTPKQYARVIRFKRAYHSLLSERRPLTSALDGFYDQSHFNREFRHFMGVSPGVRLGDSMNQATNVTDHLLQADLGATAN
ncbi:MAG TPA: helix-turn-helix domain-containing protein [Steroidobacteraceae bacterium]